MSAEPSMEDILSSIKRIIAEEGDPNPARPRRQVRPAPRAVEPAEEPDPVAFDEEELDEVLELNDPMPHPSSRSAPAAAEPAPVVASQAAPQPAPEPIVSQQTAAATRGSLDALSRMLVKPEPASDGTLEGLVREMLRPMLREWLDANLPAMVDDMVKREIAKITGRPG